MVDKITKSDQAMRSQKIALNSTYKAYKGDISDNTDLVSQSLNFCKQKLLRSAGWLCGSFSSESMVRNPSLRLGRSDAHTRRMKRSPEFRSPKTPPKWLAGLLQIQHFLPSAHLSNSSSSIHVNQRKKETTTSEKSKEEKRKPPPLAMTKMIFAFFFFFFFLSFSSFSYYNDLPVIDSEKGLS